MKKENSSGDHKTIFNSNFKILEEDNNFNYQPELTQKLDSLESDFNQNILNEIILWKVNRYANFEDDTIRAINNINSEVRVLNKEKTASLLRLLLRTKGVKLAMASTILRFKNPDVYQIIDQRVYRVIYDGQELNLSGYLNDEKIEQQIELYFKYLEDLKEVCLKFKIPFSKSDRILYMVDKRINKNKKLKNY